MRNHPASFLLKAVVTQIVDGNKGSLEGLLKLNFSSKTIH